MRALPLCFVTACSWMQTEGDFFVVRNDGADLPVWVRGDVASGTFLVWLAGGPGDPVAIVHGEATAAIEAEMAVVYADQRGAGSAGGNASPESFTIDQYVEDTEAVLDVVRARYDVERIFLLGHSWGGTLATAYLLDEGRQAGVAGYVDVAGNHDQIRVFPMKVAWLWDYAVGRIAAGDDVEHWSEVRDWCATNPPISVESFALWNEWVGDTNAVFHDPDVGYEITFDLLFRSAESPFAYLFVNDGYGAENLTDDPGAFQELSFGARMSAITLPALLLWGRHDGIVPIEAADDARASLGTAPDDLEEVVFESSAHFPFFEEPTGFAEAVARFVAGRS
jgi:pimeloyl-ACP methyl ester carboxylesterase